MTQLWDLLRNKPGISILTFSLLGLTFPVIATIIALDEARVPVSAASILSLHMSQPLLLIVDIAPLALGGILWLLATQSRSALSDYERILQSATSKGQNIQQIVDTCFDALITTGAGGVIENWNDGAEQLFGYTREQAIGQPLNMIDPPETRSGPRSQLSQASRERERCIIEGEFITKEGRRFTASSSVGVLRNDSGQPTGLLAIVRDMSARKQMEDALIKARDAAESANEAKSRFLANMSHEIRTPMNGIIGMTQVLLDTRLDDQQTDFLNTLYASAEQLSYVINDILDLSKLEAGKLDIAKKAVDVGRLVRTTSRMFSTTTQSKGVELDVKISSDVPESIVGDYHRIKQVLTNLLSNAVKFTDRGKVTVRTRVSREIRDDVVLSFEVEDTGTGMSEEQCQRIFAPFTQVDDSNTRAAAGTGLGLSICKQIVECMDGEIGVVSEQGRGSTFWFTIRTTRCELDPTGIEEILEGSFESVAGTKVLLVDDNVVNQKVAVALLRGMECETDVAGNGAEAVKAIDASRYDVVLMDVQMPVMDGFEATEAVRQSSPHADVPIIAMTARAMAGDREECMSKGMDDHLPKPVSKELLREKLALWRSRRSEKACDDSDLRARMPAAERLRELNGEIEDTQMQRVLAASEDSSEHNAQQNSASAAPIAQVEGESLNIATLNGLLEAMGDAGLSVVEEIIEEFLQNVPEECDSLCDAAQAGDAKRVREVAHKMRSSTGNLGVERMYNMCSELEEQARNGDISQAIERADAIKAEFTGAAAAIQSWATATLHAGAAAGESAA